MMTSLLAYLLSILLYCSLYVIFVATFLAAMLFFWLELFGDLAAGNMQVCQASNLHLLHASRDAIYSVVSP